MSGMYSWQVGRWPILQRRSGGLCHAMARLSPPKPAQSLFARPLGLALAQEGGDALARVLRRERGHEAVLLGLDPVVKVGLGRDLLDLLHRHRRLTAKLARPGQRRV